MDNLTSTPLVAGQPEWSITLADLEKLPRAAVRGLFLAYAEIGDKKNCEGLFPALQLMKNLTSVDDLLVKAALKIFDSPEGWRAIVKKGNVQKWEASQAEGFEAASKYVEHADLADVLLSACTTGNMALGMELLDGDFCTLKRKVTLVRPDGSQYAVTPMEWAIKAQEVEMSLRLMHRAEWCDLIKERVCGEEQNNKRFQGYGLASDFGLSFSKEDLWENFPSTVAQIVEEYPLEQINPTVVLTGYCAHPEARNRLVKKFGVEALQKHLVKGDQRAKKIGLLSESADPLALVLLQEVLKQPDLKRQLLDLKGSRRELESLDLYTAKGPLTRQATWEALGPAGVTAYARSIVKLERYYHRSCIKDLLVRAENCGDYRVLSAFFKEADWKTLLSRAYETEQTFMAFYVESASEEGMEVLMDSLKGMPDTARQALTEEGWILESAGLRKKGDALASAIGNGKLFAAQILLKHFPDLTRVRAKETLKYLKKRDTDLGGKAFSAFESLIFSEALGLDQLDPQPVVRSKKTSHRGL